MQQWQDYFKSNEKRFMDELFAFLRIPSVSAKKEHQQDMHTCAEYVKTLLSNAGIDDIKIFQTKGHPIVFGQKEIDPNKPTVLIYGHYDVQPADPLGLWQTPPFEPVIRDGKIFARGAVDDKGQIFAQIKAFEIMNRTNTLNANVKFLIEGEEEVGSTHLAEFLTKEAKLLRNDVVVVSDTSIMGLDTPSIEVSLRGLCYFEIELTGPNKDLHSGVFGGAAPNPIQILCKILASLHDYNNHITIPGFYDGVQQLTDEEKSNLNSIPFNEDAYKKSIGVTTLWGEKGYSVFERTGTRPTLEINGIWGGYIEDGSKTVLPSKAYAKISCRLVHKQSAENICELVKNYLRTIAPPQVTLNVKRLGGLGDPYYMDSKHPAFIAGTKAMEKTFGKKVFATRGGGSIPIVIDFERILGSKTLLLGFGLDSNALHSPNEHFNLACYEKAIETIPYFFKFFTEK